MKNSSPYLASGSSEESTRALPDWRELVAILIERAWVGVAVAVAVFLLFYLHAARQTPYYRSVASLIVEAQIPRLLNVQDVVAYNTRNLEMFNTHLNALHSRSMMEKALVQSGLDQRSDFFPDQPTMEGKAKAALALVNIRPVEKSRMITITVEHHDAQVASDLANALAKAYIAQDIENRMTASMQAVQWLRERSEEYREKLEQGLRELQQYREQTESVSLEDDQNIIIAKLKSLNNSLTEAQTERIAAETSWRALQVWVEQGGPSSRLASLLNVDEVHAAHQRVQEQQRVVAGLKQRYRSGHPDLQEALELETRLQRSFEETIRVALEVREREYLILKDREAGLLAALREQEQLAFGLDRKLVRYNDLKRNVEADQEIYSAVIARMKEANLSESMPAEIILLAEEARPAAVPFRPQPGQAMVRGAGLGMVLGVLSIFALYTADHRFRRSEEIERQLGIPVLAMLPLCRSMSAQERAILCHAQPSGDMAESFRTLRASLSMNDAAACKTMMVTSAYPGEGKSLVALNLAISMAQDHKRILVLGADLRRPTLETMLQAGDQPGLADVLSGRVAWREALLRHNVSGLAVMGAGRTRDNPADLLGHARLADLLEDVKREYDMILLDAPPLLGISDSLVLLPRVDGVLFMVRYGVTHSHGASMAMRKIRESGTACIGGVLNGVNLKSMANYYYYRHDRGYAYTGSSRDVGST